MEILTPNLDKIKPEKWFMPRVYKPFEILDIATLLNNEVWITAERIKIPVREMKTRHITNCIRCWNGEGKSVIPDGYLGGKEKWLKIFNQELINRQ